METFQKTKSDFDLHFCITVINQLASCDFVLNLQQKVPTPLASEYCFWKGSQIDWGIAVYRSEQIFDLSRVKDHTMRKDLIIDLTFSKT